jgi:GntR family transcriptional repressor for pyruvate dehydrogenase complex
MKMRAAVIGQTDALPVRVASVLTREIAEGGLSPGARLPTESQLAARYGVSRTVVREAVAQLRADGLIEARQGVGAFILAPEQRRAIRIDRDALRELGAMRDLFELRCILETQAAGIAAVRRSEAALDRIGAALARMAGEERWEEGSIEADLVFHREIARATGNAYIESFTSFVCEHIRQSIEYARHTNPIRDLVEVNVGEHVRIHDALVRGDAADASAAMRAHITGAAARVGIDLFPNLPAATETE